MSEVLSVQGQLVGIPVEQYTGVSGIVVDPVNKTIRADETVLFKWTGTGKNLENSFTISEPLTNFEMIRIKGVGYPGDDGQLIYCLVPSPRNTSENFSISTLYFCSKNDGSPLQIIGQRYSPSNNGLTYTIIDKKFLYWTLTGTEPASSTSNRIAIEEIVGINRKA
jgi:hypothetical protein